MPSIPRQSPSLRSVAGGSSQPLEDHSSHVQGTANCSSLKLKPSVQLQVLGDIEIEKASFREVHRWQQQVFSSSIQDDDDALVVSGATAESIASTLIDLIGYYYPHHDGIVSFQPCPGVRCEMRGMISFLQQFPVIEM